MTRFEKMKKDFDELLTKMENNEEIAKQHYNELSKLLSEKGYNYYSLTDIAYMVILVNASKIGLKLSYNEESNLGSYKRILNALDPIPITPEDIQCYYLLGQHSNGGERNSKRNIDFFERVYGKTLYSRQIELNLLMKYVDSIRLCKKLESLSREQLEKYYIELFQPKKIDKNQVQPELVSINEKIEKLKENITSMGFDLESNSDYKVLLQKREDFLRDNPELSDEEIEAQNKENMERFLKAVKAKSNISLVSAIAFALGKEAYYWLEILKQALLLSDDPILKNDNYKGIKNLIDNRVQRDREIDTINQGVPFIKGQNELYLERLMQSLNDCKEIKKLAEEKMNEIEALRPSIESVEIKNSVESEIFDVENKIREYESQKSEFEKIGPDWFGTKRSKLQKQLQTTEEEVKDKLEKEKRHLAILKSIENFNKIADEKVTEFAPSILNSEEYNRLVNSYIASLIALAKYNEHNYYYSNEPPLCDFKSLQKLVDILNDAIPKIEIEITKANKTIEDFPQEIEQKREAVRKKYPTTDPRLGITEERSDEELKDLYDRYEYISKPNPREEISDKLLVKNEDGTYSIADVGEMTDKEFDDLFEEGLKKKK